MYISSKIASLMARGLSSEFTIFLNDLRDMLSPYLAHSASGLACYLVDHHVILLEYMFVFTLKTGVEFVPGGIKDGACLAIVVSVDQDIKSITT